MFEFVVGFITAGWLFGLLVWEVSERHGDYYRINAKAWPWLSIIFQLTTLPIDAIRLIVSSIRRAWKEWRWRL